ncbi:MAG TPA: ribose 5-phosphate isomerase B [Planctomycetaceae bacterium]|nr:ribose 5-phosphate isomerase B [Planctomycetaceae bacterium]HIQ20494.1 ribose 5-phosphate isomerase B [Planctomycetota bacterium]
MRIAIGSDHRGTKLRARIVELLRRWGQEVIDVGTQESGPIDYPDVAQQVARRVSAGDADRGILICGTGLGMAIVANKYPGVRAAPCHDELTAELSRRHNDLNVLCLSGDMLKDSPIDGLIKVWLSTPFEGGRHARRVRKIAELERHNGRM